tara:strand:+ start:85 stop:864 length:780 start_codon:yes stop_codon:yes gene_type:complete
MMVESIESIKINKLFSATMIGYFGNAVFPFRMGELLRAFALSKDAKIETSTAFGSILLERIIDMLGLVFTMIVFGSLYPFSDYSKKIMFYVAFVTLLILGIIIFLSFNQLLLTKFVENFPGYRKITQLLKSLLDGLTSIRDFKKSGKIIILTLLIWGIYFLITWLINISLGVGLDWIGVGVTLIFTSLAIALPAAPSAVGTYHAAAIYVLTELFLLDRSIAQSFAVVLHAVGLLPLILIGALYFIKSSVGLGDISMQRK